MVVRYPYGRVQIECEYKEYLSKRCHSRSFSTGGVTSRSIKGEHSSVVMIRDIEV